MDHYKHKSLYRERVLYRNTRFERMSGTILIVIAYQHYSIENVAKLTLSRVIIMIHVEDVA